MISTDRLMMTSLTRPFLFPSQIKIRKLQDNNSIFHSNNILTHFNKTNYVVDKKALLLASKYDLQRHHHMKDAVKNACCHVFDCPRYRNLLASLSLSRRVRTSPSRTGPFTLRMMDLFVSSKNSTLT